MSAHVESFYSLLNQLKDFVPTHGPIYTNNGTDNFTLYDYAKYTELHSRIGENVWPQVLPYLRLAAANNDTLANVRLQTYLLYEKKIPKDLIKQRGKEILDLNDKLLEQNLPTAYYRKARYIIRGLYRGSMDDADAYLRHAADLGDKDAQFRIGRRIMSYHHHGTEITSAIKFPYLLKLLGPAAEQGHVGAGFYLLPELSKNQMYREAMRYTHLAAKGTYYDDDVLLDLKYGFAPFNPVQNKSLFNIDKPDKERASRYGKIGSYVHRFSHLNPSIPDLDDIVPLPPAKLPEWDGKIAFQRWYEGPPPPKPSDELVLRLAKEYGLDPQTGLPLKR